MRKKFILGALGALAVFAALAPVASAQGENIQLNLDADPLTFCREVTVGSATFQNVCATLGENLDLRDGASAAPFVQVTCNGILHCGGPAIGAGKTGFHYNGAFPLPEVIIGSATVRHPGGTVGTLWLNGSPWATVNLPSFCVGSKEDCPGGDVIIAPL